MTQKEPKPPYDEEIARLEGLAIWTPTVRYLLRANRQRREGWLAGYKAGIAEVKENPASFGLAEGGDNGKSN